MPRYDYKCTDCGTVSEQNHSLTVEPSPSVCCQAPVSKVYTPTPVQFKGKGFYRTDSS